MSELDIVKLTTEMVNIPSVTRDSNQAIADYVEHLLASRGFEIERQSYVDPQGVSKFNVIGRKGSGEGGLAFFSHMDTVPGTGWEDEAWNLKAEPDRLIGLGACDMKGPLAATIVAADSYAAGDLTSPVYIVVTAMRRLPPLKRSTSSSTRRCSSRIGPRAGVCFKPTKLIPVYAHKGVGFVKFTAHGGAAPPAPRGGTRQLLNPPSRPKGGLPTELKPTVVPKKI